jgi:hypothetical protein
MSTYKNTDLLSALAQKLSANEAISAMGTAEAVLVPLWEGDRAPRNLWERVCVAFGVTLTDIACLKVRYSASSGFDITGVSSSVLLERMDAGAVVTMVVKAIKKNYASTNGWESAIESALAAVDEIDVEAL